MTEPIPPNTWYASKENPLDIVYIDSTGLPHKSPKSTLELEGNPRIQQTLHDSYQHIRCIAGHFTTLEDIETADFVRKQLETTTSEQLEGNYS